MHRWKVVVRRMVSTMRAKQWALFIVGFLEPQSAFKDFFFFLQLFDGEKSSYINFSHRPIWVFISKNGYLLWQE